jgi:hypothetical protein
MKRTALTLCLLSAAIATGCAAEAEAPGRTTEAQRSLPGGCRPAEVARLLDQLFDALNRNDRRAAAALVIDREMLARLAQPAAGRPLRLRAVIVGFANGLGQIEFRAVGRLVGKGALDCETRRFVAIGLGAEHERMAPLCGGRLACARHWN